MIEAVPAKLPEGENMQELCPGLATIALMDCGFEEGILEGEAMRGQSIALGDIPQIVPLGDVLHEGLPYLISRRGHTEQQWL